MIPPSEHLHWMYAGAFLLLGLCLLAQAIVGDDVWNRRPFRRYFWPGFGFLMGFLLWPAMFFPQTGATIIMVTHSLWAQMMMIAGGSYLALATGKLKSRYWRLSMPLAFVVSGFLFLSHEQHGWLYGRASFIHHICGWTLIVGALVPFAQIFRPRSFVLGTAFALTFLVISIALFSARDGAPLF